MINDTTRRQGTEITSLAISDCTKAFGEINHAGAEWQAVPISRTRNGSSQNGCRPDLWTLCVIVRGERVRNHADNNSIDPTSSGIADGDNAHRSTSAAPAIRIEIPLRCQKMQAIAKGNTTLVV